ncbi:aminotransferase class I/II-fold pyridoxal phosphate-dependent enzyme [Sorangium sp. So ce233]|uniref:aminotransferase class I/II-fold pyridoxal phosphate-dependent enzyme n=1 Tax=Sorangium sp. So ce233 TaxID=3133290 RepID=UPI003F6309C8
MHIAIHEIEPWLIRYQSARYNLAQSGVANLSVKELLQATGGDLGELTGLSFEDIDTRGSWELRQAVAGLYPGCSPESVLITHGTSEALLLYFMIRHTRGANVIIPVPAFQSLSELPRYVGYEVRPLPLRRERGFRMDLDALAEMVDHNTRVIIVNTPHNPTGMVPTAGEIEAVQRIARRVGAEVLADEHYRFMPYRGEGMLASLYSGQEGVAAVGSMGKCLGCVGLRVGWLLGPQELIDACRDLKDYTTHTMCSINDRLALLVLQRWQELAGGYRQWIASNVREFASFLQRHEEAMGWIPPEAGIVSFPFLRGRSASTLHYAQRLAEERGVFVLPGDAFGSPGHLRVGFGLPPARFAEALERWSGFVKEGRWS